MLFAAPTNVEISLISGLFLLLGVTATATFAWMLEIRKRTSEIDTHLRGAREDAYLAWMTTIPRLVFAYEDRQIAERDGQDLAKSDETVLHLETVEIRPALAKVRLFAPSEIVNQVQRVSKQLRFQAMAADPGAPIDTEEFLQEWLETLKMMRTDIGSHVESEQIDLPGVFLRGDSGSKHRTIGLSPSDPLGDERDTNVTREDEKPCKPTNSMD